MTRVTGLAAAVLFVATVWAANYAVTHWGTTSVGFGLTAPAGVWFAGLAFTLRDIVHRTLGRAVVIGCIVTGCLLAYLIEASTTIPGGHVTIALASAIAFLLSELLDLGVYEPLSDHSFVGAVVTSNVAGAALDSALFLWLAFGSLAFFWGQMVGKLWMTLAALPVVFLLRRILPEHDPELRSVTA